ncbi:MAG: tetratricopeptide repeat protein [Desulfovibrio sp.]|jgi:tetratricopeptide (TPR) repeat protein|nr:tetratricopeptide repeat protein [Desulfovibrio sp.]
MDIDVFFRDYGKAFERGDAAGVVEFLKDSINAAEADNDNHALVTILNEAAGYYRNTSDYAQAIALSEKALTTLRRLGYENTVPYGTTLLNTATAYRASGDNARGLELFISSLAVLGALLPEDDHRFAGLYNNIGAIHEERGQLPEALDMLEKAAAIMEKNPGMAEDSAIVLTNLALILLRLNRTGEAAKTFGKAEKLFCRTDARPAPQYAATLAGMGEVCFRMGDFDKAIEKYESALARIKDSFGENRDYAITCQNCADVYEAAGKSEAAAALTLRAQNILSGLDALERRHSPPRQETRSRSVSPVAEAFQRPR